MTGFKNIVTLSSICISALLLATGATAADKVQFSSPTPNASIATQPAPSWAGTLPKKQSNIGGVSVNVSPQMLPPATTSVRSRKNRDEDQENWIFRDTQSVEGIQRALGVEVYGNGGGATAGQNEPTSAIQEYFSRQNNVAPQLTPGNASGLEGLGNNANSGNFSNLPNAGAAGLFAPNNAPVKTRSFGIGQRGFQNTLNSANPAIRSHYRNLYKEQLMPSKSVVPALGTATTIGEPTAPASRTRKLYNRQAYIESITPKGPASVFSKNPTPQLTTEPTRKKTRTRRSSQVPLLERRGGKTVIPSRPF